MKAYQKPTVLAESYSLMAECRPMNKPSGRPCNPPGPALYGPIPDRKHEEDDESWGHERYMPKPSNAEVAVRDGETVTVRLNDVTITISNNSTKS